MSETRRRADPRQDRPRAPHAVIRHDVQVAVGHARKMARRLAWRCDHGSALRIRKAADRPLHWQASSRIDVWSGGVTRGSADLDLLLIADCADGRRVHACVCEPSGHRSKCLIRFNPGSNTRWPVTTTLSISHSARARTRRRSSRYGVPIAKPVPTLADLFGLLPASNPLSKVLLTRIMVHHVFGVRRRGEPRQKRRRQSGGVDRGK